jgi:hypothetical protein
MSQICQPEGRNSLAQARKPWVCIVYEIRSAVGAAQSLNERAATHRRETQYEACTAVKPNPKDSESF